MRPIVDPRVNDSPKFMPFKDQFLGFMNDNNNNQNNQNNQLPFGRVSIENEFELIFPSSSSSTATTKRAYSYNNASVNKTLTPKKEKKVLKCLDVNAILLSMPNNSNKSTAKTMLLNYREEEQEEEEEEEEE